MSYFICLILYVFYTLILVVFFYGSYSIILQDLFCMSPWVFYIALFHASYYFGLILLVSFFWSYSIGLILLVLFYWSYSIGPILLVLFCSPDSIDLLNMYYLISCEIRVMQSFYQISMVKRSQELNC